ncbi:MAG: DUF928 domain-containing protein [Prochlorothrix sp.]|nr:DUF928 domain-containing protein [Prochlorothrix sp.]
MQLQTTLTRFIAPSLLLTFAWTGGTWITAESASAQGLGSRIQNLFQQSRPLRNASGTTSGGAVRGGTDSNKCQSRGNQLPLRALSPATNQLVTAADQPTFWFYVPFGQEDGVETAELMIFEEDWDYFIEEPIQIPLPQEAALVTFTLPDDTPQLQVGAEYNWHFSLVCESDSLSTIGPWVNGWIGRVAEPEGFELSLTQNNPAEVYLEAGFWGEALSVLASQPDRYADEWEQVLELFALDTLEVVPIQTIQLDGTPSELSPVESTTPDAEGVEPLETDVRSGEDVIPRGGESAPVDTEAESAR